MNAACIINVENGGQFKIENPLLGLRFILRDQKRILQRHVKFTEYNNKREVISIEYKWEDIPLMEEK